MSSPANLLAQLLDPKLPRCRCQERTVDPYDCPMHGHLFAVRKLGPGA